MFTARASSPGLDPETNLTSSAVAGSIFMGGIMIQLIGFLLCTYMLVRGLDIRSRVEDRKSSSAASTARWASNIALIGAVLFFLLFVVQGSSAPAVPGSF